MPEGFDLTLSGLIRKRAEIGGELDALQAQLEQRMADMHALDATIRIFKPDIDLEDLPMRRVPPAHAAFRGEMARFFLSTLRAAPSGLTTLEMAHAVIKARRLNPADKVLGKTILRRTGHSLTRLRRKMLGHIIVSGVILHGIW